MARILILGGSRNLGHVTAQALVRDGHSVTVLNRGVTYDELPPEIERLRGSRGDKDGLNRAVRKREWDVVIDTTSYTGEDAGELIEIFGHRCGRIIFVSTGQVYLVRTGITAPYRESDYGGDLMPAPAVHTADYKDWLYGVDKRAAEDILTVAARQHFPIVSLRLPMIASERDHYARIQGYAARVLDGGPILVPDDGNLPIRHVYVRDAASIITHLCTDPREGSAHYNISTGESHSLESFFQMLGEELGKTVRVVRIKRELLEGRGLLPFCSPYSGRWMSELDNSLGLAEATPAEFSYTGLREYVSRITLDFLQRWTGAELKVPGYHRRNEEMEIARKGE